MAVVLEQPSGATIRERLEANERRTLSPFALLSESSKGRDVRSPAVTICGRCSSTIATRSCTPKGVLPPPRREDAGVSRAGRRSLFPHANHPHTPRLLDLRAFR